VSDSPSPFRPPGAIAPPMCPTCRSSASVTTSARP